MANRNPKKFGKRSVRADIRRDAAAAEVKRRARFAADVLPDFGAMKVGDVIEVVRVPHGTNAPQGFAHLPPSRPSHHDRFSTKAARKVSE